MKKPQKAKGKKGKDLVDEVRKVRICLLAQPKLAPEHSPDYQEVWTRPAKAALSYVPSKRILYLSNPSPGKSVTKYQPAPPRRHYVEPQSLYYIPSSRVSFLALPKIRKTVEPKPPHLSKESMSDILQQRAQWLALRAGPKGKAKPHKHTYAGVIFVRGKRVFIRTDKLEEWRRKKRKPKKGPFKLEGSRTLVLCKPNIINPKYKVIPKVDLYKKKREADVRAPLSKRLMEIYQPRTLPDEAQLDLNFEPFTIPSTALTYIATPRIIRLAKHIEKAEQGKGDEKTEDPFTVPRRALKAICSRRLAFLALPVMRD